MSSFRRYGGLNFSANNNITKSHISNSEQMNINKHLGQPNSKKVFGSNIDMSGNSILHTGTIYFQDGTTISGQANLPYLSKVNTDTSTAPLTTFDGIVTFNAQTTFSNTLVCQGVTQFSSLPLCGVTATSGNQLVNKSYVDSMGIVTTVPQVTFGEVTIDSANIYIPIDYPIQTYNGAIPAPVPVIAGNVFELFLDNVPKDSILNTTTNARDTVNNGTAFNPNYVRPLSFYNVYPGSSSPDVSSSTSYTGLQGIILSNTQNTNIKPTLLNFGTGSRNAIIYNTNQIGRTGTTGTVGGKYYDYANYSSLSSVSFPWYRESVAPGTIGSYWEMQEPIKTTEITLNYKPPSQIQNMITSNVTGVNIKNFKATFNTLGDIVNCFSPRGETGTSEFNYNIAYPNTQSVTFSNLYPESQYHFGLYSKNDALTNYSENVYPANNGYGFTGRPATGILQISSTYLPSTCNINNYDGSIFSTLFKTGTIYKSTNTSGTEPITNLFFNTTSISTKTFKKFSVSYNENSRGKISINDNKLMDIKTTITGTSYENTISFKGFFSKNVNIAGLNGNITYNPEPKTTDMYIDKLTGYYLISDGFSEIFNNPVASNSEYTMKLIQAWYDNDGTTALLSKTASQTFYVDTLSGSPTIISDSSYTPTSNGAYVSGINVHHTSVNFDLSIHVTNLYNYFYVSPVLNYEFSGGCSTNKSILNLANYSSSSKTFTLTGVTCEVSSTFQSTQKLSVTAYNLKGSTSTEVAWPVKPIIYDRPSYTFINDKTKNPTSIQEIRAFGTPTIGFRVWSNVDSQAARAVSGGSNENYIILVIPPDYSYFYSNSWYAYTQFPYDHKWSIIDTATYSDHLKTNIDTSQEMQIFNGHYGTGAAGSTGVNGYINYNSYYENLNNYSEVSRSNTSYRYTTFVWKANISGSNPTFFEFTFYNIKFSGSTPDISGSAPPYSFQGTTNRFFLFYRIDSDDNGLGASVWIDGNANGATKYENNNLNYDTEAPRLSASNYNAFNDNRIVRAPAYSLTTISNDNLVVKVSAVPINKYNRHIYCRFGCSMADNISYEVVKLSLL